MAQNPGGLNILGYETTFCDLTSDLSGYVCSKLTLALFILVYVSLLCISPFLRLTPLYLSLSPSHSSVSLLFSMSIVCVSPFVFYTFSFYHLFMRHLSLTRLSVSPLSCLPPGMHRLDLLSSITWDGLTRMQLVCAFPHPLNHYRKEYRSCAGSNRSTLSGFISQPAVCPGPNGRASGSRPGTRSACYCPQ